MAVVKITKADLAAKVEEGWKKPQLAEHYGLPVAQMTKVLQSAGLKIRKFHAPKFELVDAIEEETVVEVNDTLEEVEEVRMEEVIDESLVTSIPTQEGW